jgi:hypothetical protein
MKLDSEREVAWTNRVSQPWTDNTFGCEVFVNCAGPDLFISSLSWLDVAYLESRVFCLNVVQTCFGGQNTEKFDLFHYVVVRLEEWSTEERYIQGTPQSIIMANAAHAVPPVAINGSRTKTWSTGGVGGSLE